MFSAGDLIAALLVYRAARPRKQKVDVGAISDYWLQQQRGTSDDQQR